MLAIAAGTVIPEGTIVEPGSLWNINVPESKPGWPLGVKMLPMGVERYREIMERRIDPRGRTYYWAGLEPQIAHTMGPSGV